MSAYAPLDSRPNRNLGQMLPPLPVSTQALAEFSDTLDSALHTLEQQFKAKEKVGPGAFRKAWKPKPNRPR
ncbi:MAG: hypothetical protein RH917_02250 [Lacipirellulaceae bacterium]